MSHIRGDRSSDDRPGTRACRRPAPGDRVKATMSVGDENSVLRVVSVRLRQCLANRHVPWLTAMLAMLLCLPALRIGLLLDDDLHCLALTRPDLPMLARSPAELFDFIKGDPAANLQSRTIGFLPWWSDEHLRLAFFRPLTGLTHWLDYRLWPDSPSLMHIHSLLWYGAVVVATAVLYRRMLGVTWVAGLAALLYAVDDAHGFPAVWIANRNALLGAFFGVVALILHDRWRRKRWWPGAILAPLAFGLGLLSKESTVAVGGYLLAYALLLDRGTWTRRLASLTPCAFVVIAWWVTYRLLGYGTTASGWYIDPGADLTAFVQAVATRAPNLIAWQWLVPSDVHWSLSPQAERSLWLFTMVALLITAATLASLLWRDRLARFWALGMCLSLLPACAAFPADRLLMYAGIGAMGLVAQFVAAVVQSRNPKQRRSSRRLPAIAVCSVLLVVHLIIAPWNLARTATSLAKVGSSVAEAAASLPTSSHARFQTVLIVNAPSYAAYAYGALRRFAHNDPYLSLTFVLGSSSRPITIQRLDDHTLAVRPDGGFLAPLGNAGGYAEMQRLLFNQRAAVDTLDRLYRGSTPMVVGQRIPLLCGTVEIGALTDDGRPEEAVFHLALDLDSPLFRWLKWQDGRFVPFEVPSEGKTLTLPPAQL